MQVERFRNSPVGRLVAIDGHDPRFGERYEHWAFVPHPLPDEVVLASTTVTIVVEATLALGRLDQAGRQIPNTALLRRPTLRREAQSTSALEGTYAPLSEVLAADPTDTRSRSSELAEVLNYVRAAEHAYQAISDRPLTLQLLFELHALLVSGTAADGPESGRIRAHQVVIGATRGRVTDARFVPPPPGRDLEDGVRQWAEWANKRHALIPPVVAAALAHYQFECLHPFNDGNGRIGRMIIVLQLMMSGTLREPLLTVSPWFEAHRSDYQDELTRVSESGDWDRWITFFATALRDQAVDTTNKIDELTKRHRVIQDLCRSHDVRGTALAVAEGLIARPIVTARWIQYHYGVSYPTANNAVARLEQLGLLRETTGGSYARVFAADDILRVLER